METEKVRACDLIVSSFSYAFLGFYVFFILANTDYKYGKNTKV